MLDFRKQFQEIIEQSYIPFNIDKAATSDVWSNIYKLNVLPSRSHPFCWHADKMEDKGFQPACLFQWLDLFADMTDEIEIEVLQHGGNHHENHVLSHKGKWKM